MRDLALFDCGIDAKLRACDLVKLRVSDVAPGGALRARATVIQQKTGRPVPFEIMDRTRDALSAWLKLRGPREDDWLSPSRTRAGEHMSTRHYARLVQGWVALINLEPKAYGAHSLRRTKVAMLYKKTGNLHACQLLLGHRKLESTVSASRSMAPLPCPSRSISDPCARSRRVGCGPCSPKPTSRTAVQGGKAMHSCRSGDGGAC